MSDSPLSVPAEFSALEVPNSLQHALHKTRVAIETRKVYARMRQVVKATGVALPFVMGLWAVAIGTIRWYTGSFAFIGGTMSCGFTAAFVIVIVGALLIFGVMNNDKEGQKAVLGLGGMLVALFLVWAFLPFLPIVLAVLVIVAFPLLNHQEGKHEDTSIRSDIRFRDFEGLIEHIESWNQVTQWANQLRLRVEHNLLQDGDRARAIQLLVDLQADERFVRDRMAYCTSLAMQGELGTRVTRDDMGALLISDLSDRLNGFRDRVERLREFDRKAIAAGEVRKLGTV